MHFLLLNFYSNFSINLTLQIVSEESTITTKSSFSSNLYVHLQLKLMGALWVDQDEDKVYT